MVETLSGWTVVPGAELANRAMDTFRTVVGTLLGAGVTVVAEHPLRGEVRKEDLAVWSGLCRPKLVRCRLAPTSRPDPIPEPRVRTLRTGGAMVERPRRGRPAPPPGLAVDTDPKLLGIPFLETEPTPRGYKPPLGDIVWFLRQADQAK